MKRLLWAIALLPCLALAQHAPAFQEKLVMATIDRFSESQRENYYVYENMLEEVATAPDSIRFHRYRNNAFFKSLQEFYTRHAEEYQQLRYVRYAMFAPPPPDLLRMRWDAAGVKKDLEEMDGKLDLLTPAFFRVFDPQTVAHIISGFMTATAFNDNASGMKLHHQIRDWYGIRYYTQRITPSEWQVWAADRNMAITFRFHLTTGIVRPLARTFPNDPAYQNIAWTPSPQYFQTESEKLYAEALSRLWNSYRPGALIDSRADLQKKQALLQGFRSQNAQRYRKAVLHQLERLPVPPALPVAFKEKTQPGDELLEYSDSISHSALNLTPAQWATTLEAAAFPYFGLNKNLLKVVSRNAYFPTQRYARKISDAEWEVTVIQEMSAMTFTWNIDSGMVRNARYWMKEGWE